MNKGVDRVEFWRDRIKTAQKESFSVYVTSEKDWNRINEAHKTILESEIRPGQRVLDAGCGYGRWAYLFDDYVGVDFSPDFIELAQSKHPDKKFIQADLKRLPFDDESFDVAFCVSIKKMIIDNLGETAWQDMEDELRRVAKKVLILEYETPEPHEIL
jgi:ubiquinone/menaquinone biosynthesis C-methylase UbiE